MISEVQVASVTLANPVMTAAGTSGVGAELAAYGDLSRLGAVVVKSLAAFPWEGNPAPRLIGAGDGMLNAVGLQGPGAEVWRDRYLPELREAGASVVASIWGRTPEEYGSAAAVLAGSDVVAVEVNLSCPNLSGGHAVFAHDPAMAADAVEAARRSHLPLWAKLSPNTHRLVEVAQAVREAGAEALTLVNTLLGLVLDPVTGRAVLGAGGGGYSGKPVHPVALRAVYEMRRAMPDMPIVGVGGISDGWSAAAMMLAGAHALQVGTATFADPRAPWRVLDGLVRLAESRHTHRLADLTGGAHRRGWGVHDPAPPGE